MVTQPDSETAFHIYCNECCIYGELDQHKWAMIDKKMQRLSQMYFAVDKLSTKCLDDVRSEIRLYTKSLTDFTGLYETLSLC